MHPKAEEKFDAASGRALAWLFGAILALVVLGIVAYVVTA